jgi:rhodanese-related sulfurtransferase
MRDAAPAALRQDNSDRRRSPARSHERSKSTMPIATPTLRLQRRRTLLLGLLALSASACAQSDADAVSLEHARAEFEAGRAILIDIREPVEHATGVAQGAKLLPMRQLGQRLNEIPTDPAMPVLLICNTQNRSGATLRALRERAGYGHVRYVHGGMSGWAQRGWPMVKPAK